MRSARTLHGDRSLTGPTRRRPASVDPAVENAGSRPGREEFRPDELAAVDVAVSPIVRQHGDHSEAATTDDRDGPVLDPGFGRARVADIDAYTIVVT